MHFFLSYEKDSFAYFLVNLYVLGNHWNHLDKVIFKKTDKINLSIIINTHLSLPSNVNPNKALVV